MFNPFENMPAFMQQFQLFQQQMQGRGNPQQLVQNMFAGMNGNWGGYGGGRGGNGMDITIQNGGCECQNR